MLVINKKTKIVTRHIWGQQRQHRLTLFGWKFYF